MCVVMCCFCVRFRVRLCVFEYAGLSMVECSCRCLVACLWLCGCSYTCSYVYRCVVVYVFGCVHSCVYVSLFMCG